MTRPGNRMPEFDTYWPIMLGILTKEFIMSDDYTATIDRLQSEINDLRAKIGAMARESAHPPLKNIATEIDPCPLCGGECLHRPDWPVIKQDVSCSGIKNDIKCVYRVPSLKTHQQIWKWKRVYHRMNYAADEKFRHELIVAAIQGFTTRAVVMTDSAARDAGVLAVKLANAVIAELKKEESNDSDLPF